MSNQSRRSGFADRHIGPGADDIATMLAVIGVDSLAELASRAVPATILDTPRADGSVPGRRLTHCWRKPD